MINIELPEVGDKCYVVESNNVNEIVVKRVKYYQDNSSREITITSDKGNFELYQIVFTKDEAIRRLNIDKRRKNS